jgi:hypothetical protein
MKRSTIDARLKTINDGCDELVKNGIHPEVAKIHRLDLKDHPKRWWKTSLIWWRTGRRRRRKVRKDDKNDVVSEEGMWGLFYADEAGGGGQHPGRVEGYPTSARERGYHPSRYENNEGRWVRMTSIIKCETGSHRGEYAVVNVIRENTYQVVGYCPTLEDAQAYKERLEKAQEPEKEE